MAKQNMAEGVLTAVLVRNDLGLVVDQVGDGAVGVAKGDADGGALAWLGASLCPVVTHFACWPCLGDGGVGEVKQSAVQVWLPKIQLSKNSGAPLCGAVLECTGTGDSGFHCVLMRERER